MDFPNLLSTGLAVVSIATLAGLGLLRGTVTNLREQLRDARDETAAIRESRAEEQREYAKAQVEANTLIAQMKSDYDTAIAALKSDSDSKVAQLTADLNALKRVVTGEVHWVALGQQLEEHHAEAMEHWQREEEAWGDVLALLRSPGKAPRKAAAKKTPPLSGTDT